MAWPSTYCQATTKYSPRSWLQARVGPTADGALCCVQMGAPIVKGQSRADPSPRRSATCMDSQEKSVKLGAYGPCLPNETFGLSFCLGPSKISPRPRRFFVNEALQRMLAVSSQVSK